MNETNDNPAEPRYPARVVATIFHCRETGSFIFTASPDYEVEVAPSNKGQASFTIKRAPEMESK